MSVCCYRETLETKECLVKGEEMTLMPKRNQSGSLVGPPVSPRPLSLLVLMTRSWRRTKEEPNAPGRSQNPLEKACDRLFSTALRNVLYKNKFPSMLTLNLSLTVECNGGLEDPGVVRESGADQEVPHAEVLPEQPPGEFDFNEFFNLEKTMPGLASVRYGEHCMLY